MQVPGTPSSIPADPHVEWSRLLDGIRRTMDGPPDLEDADIDRLGDQMCELHGLIAETPANTIAGIACQVRVAITTLRGAATLECGEMALEQVVRALEQRGEFRA